MLRKTAVFDVLDVTPAHAIARQTPLGSISRIGHRHIFDFEPRYGYLYVRSRMISSRCNDNFDEFPAEEIKKAYRTFIGKPVFVNHHNDDHRRMRGLIIDAVLHEDRNPDGSPDTWVEGLMEIDALRYPKLAKALVHRHIERTSMGVDVEYSLCSKCGNKATTPLEYCRHVPGMKGKRIYSFTKSGARVSELIREKCYGLGFFENSLLVEPPADPTAWTLDKPILGPGLEHLVMTARVSKVAAQRADAVMMRRLRPADMSLDDLFDTDVELSNRATALGKPGQVSKIHQQVRDELNRQLSKNSHLSLVAGMRCVACQGLNTVADLAGNHECVDCEATWNPRTASWVVEAAPRHPNPADHPWFQAHPVSHTHILDHWHAATPEERAQGMHWYSDAHIIASALGKHHEVTHGIVHPEGANHVGAGIIAVYSPQQGWTGNMHNAARVLHANKGMGGPGSGIMASNQQRIAADRILAGENYNDVVKGPKVRDFAHLIEHGGDANKDEPHVVIDRHALSVATGHRLTDDEYTHAPVSQRHYYNHVVQAYHRAAQDASSHSDAPVAGHQMQAATWLVRQRLNQAEEKAAAEAGQDTRLNRGRDRARGNSEKAWESWRTENLPHLPSAGPGTGYVARHRHAYGETKAPSDVDTLRDEACPVCGEENAYNGSECKVCGFVAPPKEFQDPNLDLAKQVDLRKDVADLDSMDVDDLNDDLNDVDKDGFDDQTGEPINEDVQPTLVCSNCGTEFEAGEPVTTDTRDPQAGDAGLGPDEGDVCPACGQGVLEAPGELDVSEQDDQNRSEPEDPAASAQEASPPTRERGEEDEDADEQDEQPDNDEDPDAEERNFVPSDEDSDPDEDDDDEDKNDENTAPVRKRKGVPARQDRNPFK